MDNIFESLENLNVSEECFDDIMGIVEGMLMDFATGATYSKDRDTRRENAQKRENFAAKHPKLHAAIRDTEKAVSKPLDAIKGVANKAYDKATDAVTNMKGPVGNKVRQTKIARKLFGNRAIKNAQKGINSAKNDWNNQVKDDMAANAGQPETHTANAVKAATKKAVDTEKKWGARIHY